MLRSDRPAMSERSTTTTSQGERGARPGSSQTTLSHLRDRDQEFVALGWGKGAARWLALVALHGGLFLRAQYAAFHGCSQATARRFFARLIAGDWARLFPIADERGGRSPAIRDSAHGHAFGELGPLAEHLQTVSRVRRAAFALHGTVPPIIEAGSAHSPR